MAQAMRVGDRLRFFRRERRLTQTELAERLHIAQSTLSDYERGALQIDADELPSFAEVLGVQPAAFYGEETRPITMAEIIRSLETMGQSHDNHVADQSGLPALADRHPAPFGGQREDGSKLSGPTWLERFGTVLPTPGRELVLS